MQKYDVVFTPNFKRDYKLAQKRGYEIGLLKEIVKRELCKIAIGFSF